MSATWDVDGNLRFSVGYEALKPCPECGADVDSMTQMQRYQGYSITEATHVHTPEPIRLNPCGHRVDGYVVDGEGNHLRWTVRS